MKKSHLILTALLAMLLSVAPSLQTETLIFAEGGGRNASDVVTVQAEITVNEGRTSGTLSVTVDVEEGYHVYAMSQPKPFIATQIHLDKSDHFKVLDPFEASRAPQVHVHETLNVELHELEGKITWTVRLRLVDAAHAEKLTVSGHVYAQACNASGCLAPKEYPFTARLNGLLGHVVDSRAALPIPTSIQEKPPSESNGLSRPTVDGDSTETSEQGTGAADAEGAKDSQPRLDFSKLEAEGSTADSLPLIVVLPMAFVAGLILNFMPCVLPVIGLKVMAFAQQAGDKRSRVFMLNLWYSLGLMSVFLVLATLALFLGLGWGEQFSSVTFNVILASVVFVFALSFLGIWEIPIPGFVGTGKANQLADKEGLAGAFSKGVLTTILATPCSGPLLGPALTWAVSQPPAMAYAGFAAVGLGMASPYLLIGTFPKLVAFLPKPGAWMDTFKQTMGFILLGTVVFLLTFISIPYVVPTVALIIGLWAACWWIGRTPLTESLNKKLRTWLTAGAFATLIGVISFGWLHGVMASRFQRAVDREFSKRNLQLTRADSSSNIKLNQTVADLTHEGNELPWRTYSRELLEQLTAQQKTVFIDFTADW